MSLTLCSLRLRKYCWEGKGCSITHGSFLPFACNSTLKLPASRTSITPATPAKRNRQRSSPTAPLHHGTHPAYNPFSALSYLSRLRTFSLTTYPSKPPALSPQACAQAGWIHEGGKDRLFCRVCQNAWRVEVPGDVVGGIRLNAQMSE